MTRAALVLAAAAAFAAAPGTALAAGVVQNSADMGTGSLRQALAGGGTVTFMPGLGPIALDSTIAVTSKVTIFDPEGDVTVGRSGAFAGAGPLLDFQGGSDTSTVGGVNFTNPGGEGVKVETGQHVAIQRSPIYDVTQPIDLVTPLASAPTLLSIGHRQADGTLPLSGTGSAGGTIDAYDGDPAGSTPTTFVGGGAVSAGAFTVPLAGNPTAGGTVRATLTAANGATSRVLRARRGAQRRDLAHPAGGARDVHQRAGGHPQRAARGQQRGPQRLRAHDGGHAPQARAGRHRAGRLPHLPDLLATVAAGGGGLARLRRARRGERRRRQPQQLHHLDPGGSCARRLRAAAAHRACPSSPAGSAW